MINIKNFNSDIIKVDEKSYRNVLIYYIGFETTNKSLYLIINKIDEYIEESSGNRDLTQVPTDTINDTLKRDE